LKIVGKISYEATWEKAEEIGFTKIPDQEAARFDIAAPWAGSLYVTVFR
jgi:hypothetical protein